jgi:hypothetical protein
MNGMTEDEHQKATRHFWCCMMASLIMFTVGLFLLCVFQLLSVPVWINAFAVGTIFGAAGFAGSKVWDFVKKS